MRHASMIPSASPSHLACAGCGRSGALGEAFEERRHFIGIGGIEQALFEHLVDGVARAPELACSGVDVIVGPAQRDIRAEQGPVGAGSAFIRRANTARVHIPVFTEPAVELTVGMAPDDQSLVDRRENLGQALS